MFAFFISEDDGRGALWYVREVAHGTARGTAYRGQHLQAWGLQEEWSSGSGTKRGEYQKVLFSQLWAVFDPEPHVLSDLLASDILADLQKNSTV